MKEREMKYLPENQHFCGKGGKRIRQVYLDLNNPELLEKVAFWLPQADQNEIAELRIREEKKRRRWIGQNNINR